MAARPEFVSANTVAVYLAADGEVDTQPLIELAWRAGKQVYLPVLWGKCLRFARYRPHAALRRNRLGIAEPAVKSYRSIARLDLILMPLVGFDDRGGRLGMGGGFYDRSFARLPAKRRRPARVGLAHACQHVDSLPLEPWDVPLTAVATDRRWLTIGTG